MNTAAYRIAELIWRDLSLRAGFREVVDQVPTEGINTQLRIVEYWAERIDAEIGDNRLIAALEEIAANPSNAAYIAKRALGPAKQEQAAKLGITQFVADGESHRAEQLGLSLTKAPDPRDNRITQEQLLALADRERAIASKIHPAEQSPTIDPDDFM